MPKVGVKEFIVEPFESEIVTVGNESKLIGLPSSYRYRYNLLTVQSFNELGEIWKR